MNKIRDFIYDFNDIVVALLIIAITAGIVCWRVDTIMDYPAYLAAKASGPQIPDTDFTDVDLTPGEVDVNLNRNPEDVDIPEAPGEETQGGQTEVGENQEGEAPQGGQTEGEQPEGGENQGEQGQTSSGKLADGKTTEDTRISIPSGVSSSKIGDILLEAGLIESKDAFNKAVSDKNAEQKLKAGDFMIPAGSTVADIVNIISK